MISTLQAFVGIVVALSLVFPPQVWAGFIPSVVDRSDEQVKTMGETRRELECKIIANYQQARGKASSADDLAALSADQRTAILDNDIPKYLKNDDGTAAALLFLAPFLLLGIGLGAGIASSNEDKHEKYHDRHKKRHRR